MKHAKRLKKRFLAVCGVIAIMASLILGCCCTASAATIATIINEETGLPYQEGEGIRDGFTFGTITGSTYAINFYCVMLNHSTDNQPFFVPNIQGHEERTEQLIDDMLDTVQEYGGGTNMGITENTVNNGSRWVMEYVDYITDHTAENEFIETLILKQTNFGSDQTTPITDRFGDMIGVMLRPYVYNSETGTKMYLIYGEHYQVVNADNGPYMLLTLSGDNIVNDYQIFGIEMENYYSDYATTSGQFATYWFYGGPENPNGLNGYEIDAQADYKTGYNIGYQNGNANKQQFGAEKYQEGYFQGSSDAEEYSVYTLIEYIGNLPATFINSMLGFEVFGINVAMFVKVIFTLGVVAFVVFCLVKVILAFW